MALDLAQLITAKKQAQSKLLHPQDFINLLAIWDGWNSYDPVRSVELLADYLGPFKKADIPATPVPSLFNTWQLLAVARILSLSKAQVYTLLLQAHGVYHASPVREAARSYHSASS